MARNGGLFHSVSLLLVLGLLLQDGQCAVEGQSCGLDPYQSRDQCDVQFTKMVCRQGRCYCPSRTSYQNFPLNTVWYSGLNKCVSVFRSACDLSYSFNGYSCEPGSTCRPFTDRVSDGVGMCKGANIQPTKWNSGIPLLVLFCFWFCGK